jgi:membrane-associated protease RseP (regulator of RpoE activity)
VPDGSAAARAGLKTGDLVQQVNGRRVSKIGLMLRLSNRSKGSPLTLRIVRDQQAPDPDPPAVSHATHAQTYGSDNHGAEMANATKQEQEFERLMKERGPAKPCGSERRQITRVRDPRPPPVLSSLWGLCSL